ncbi:hypothetical protein N6O07_14480, partial [Escherichia coli]|uniref:hypothetical protein n=1 Tax=Escherichia coli TaxID=562 RepID=UPI00234D491D
SDGNGSHASTLKSPSYTKSVSWQHYRTADRNRSHWSTSKTPSYTKSVSWQHHPHRPSQNLRPGIPEAD